ncbi:hypothetical protein P2L57_16715 [Streptomyces ferralitis]|uniref:Uncharacterized protein n=1 Tax=Streptantibioticus ferralitis TaxID=236510 RepID=A0ABT5Z0N6_9ACTN|nr:hypothetical protein [Streptantibioticus ferralitis]MDF2257313.1 hypothetical protein [Streptantibioticus ferralitis]
MAATTRRASLFLVTWLFALLYWRIARIEEKWSANMRPTNASGD